MYSFVLIMCFLLLFYLILGISCSKVEEMNIASGGSTSLKFLQETPDFIGPIKNVTVAIGREAVLSCSVTDLGHYKVGWMKADDQTILSLHTRVITHNPRVSVTHDDSLKTWQLRIRQLKESDRGCYMCQINTSQMKKQHGCIDVQVPPDIDDTATSSDVTVSEGENVTLSCCATGHPEPRILWRREDGNQISLHVSPQETQKVDSFSGAVLTLVRVNRRQMGPYLCIASNDVPPAVSKRVTIFVNFLPKIQVQKTLIGTPQSSNVKLKCEVESFPVSNNYWMRERDEVLLNGYKYTTSEKRNGPKVIMVLTINNVSEVDYVSYTCIASNIKGKSDASVRLYEIKLPITTTTTTTTTSTAPSITESNLILEITNAVRSSPARPQEIPSDAIDMAGATNEELSEWMYPSVAPAPLELETLSRATLPTAIISHYHFTFLLFLFTLR